MLQKSSTKQYRKQRTRNQRKLDKTRTVFMVASLAVLWMLLCGMLAKAWLDEEPVSGSEYIGTIKVSPVNYGSSKSAIISQAIYVSEEAANAEAVAFFPVPLDQDTQIFIIRKCEKMHIEPSVIMAMIDQESDFRPDCIGDNGDSVGLMQVQEKHHRERMDKLGVTDLADPLQNVTVGMDYLAELLDKGNGLEWALMAYNAGASGANKGYGSGYAAEVLANSKNLKDGVEDVYFQIG